jgi:addiction module HigA family antidote
MEKLDPITPGEILSEEFLKPMGLSQYQLAKEIGVPAQRISEIVGDKRSITADTDLRLCRFFGLSNGYWLRAQAAHDTEVAERRLGPTLEKIRTWNEIAGQRGDTADAPSLSPLG